MDGITIGDGAVIAAGALVVNDIEPYVIVAGVPAKTIRYRFENTDTIRELMKIKWWDMSISWIQQNASLFKNVEVFLKCYSDVLEKG